MKLLSLLLAFFIIYPGVVGAQTGKIVVGNVDGYPSLGHSELTGNNGVYRLFSVATFNSNSWNADHATVVTSIINGRTTGLAKDAYVWTIPIWSPYDRSIYGSNTGLLSAYRTLTRLGARVINHELNSTDVAGSPARTWTRGRLEVISQVSSVVFVQPMGNNGIVVPSHSYTRGIETLDHLILVGATNASGRIWSGSNRPGEGCFYPVCRETDKYKYRWITTPGVNVKGAGSPSGYLYWTGTSFSAPQVSAAAALIIRKKPSLTPREVVKILLETATDLGEPGVDGVYGRGQLNIQAAMEAVDG